MKHVLKGIVMPMIVMVTTSAHAQEIQQKFLGEWWSPQKDSRILIFTRGPKYYGKITWGSGREQKDVHNPNKELRSRDVVGTEILMGFTYNSENSWTGGEIYDPRDGKTYSCKMSLEGNTRLKIRGYVGLSMFGRTEIWTKNQ